MRLLKLYDDDKKAMKLRSKRLPEGWEDIEQVFHYQGLPYVLKVIRSELISKYHNELSCKSFWYRKDSQVDSQKILLVDTTTRRQGLCQRLRYLFGFKGSLLQAIQ